MLKKVVNLGLGAAKSVEENLSSALKKAETGINELISRGETESGEGAAKVRAFVDDLLVSVKEYESKATDISGNLKSALEEFKNAGSTRIDELTKKIEEITSKIKGDDKPAG